MRNQHRKILDNQDGNPPITPSDSLFSSNTSNSTTIKPYVQTSLGFDSSMALTALVLLTAIFFMVFFAMYLRRFAASRHISTLELSSIRRQRRRRNSSSSSSLSSSSFQSGTSSNSLSSSQGLDPLTVKSLPLFAYQGNLKESMDCVVCLSEFEERETVKMIPNCGHLFHPECIDKWFSSHVSCPLCRSTSLFPSTSLKKKKMKKDILEKGVDLECGQSTVERSPARNGDICTNQLQGRIEVEEEHEQEQESSGGLRRSISLSRLRDKVSLTRSFSF